MPNTWARLKASVISLSKYLKIYNLNNMIVVHLHQIIAIEIQKKDLIVMTSNVSLLLVVMVIANPGCEGTDRQDLTNPYCNDSHFWLGAKDIDKN